MGGVTLQLLPGGATEKGEDRPCAVLSLWPPLCSGLTVHPDHIQRDGLLPFVQVAGMAHSTRWGRPVQEVNFLGTRRPNVRSSRKTW